MKEDRSYKRVNVVLVCLYSLHMVYNVVTYFSRINKSEAISKELLNVNLVLMGVYVLHMIYMLKSKKL